MRMPQAKNLIHELGKREERKLIAKREKSWKSEIIIFPRIN